MIPSNGSDEHELTESSSTVDLKDYEVFAVGYWWEKCKHYRWVNEARWWRASQINNFKKNESMRIF